MKDSINLIVSNCTEQINKCNSLNELHNIKVCYLGKSGELTLVLRSIKDASETEKPLIGKYVNEARNTLEQAFELKKQQLTSIEMQKKLDTQRIDITINKESAVLGTFHPITIINNEIIDIFIGLGFTVFDGVEIETDYYNFQALNIPKDHPARDMQDTFYITDSILLRTHTSPSQIRYLENNKPPLKMLCPGKVYRSDEDATHTPIFHQIEGLVVDTNVTLRDLKGVLEEFAKKLFNTSTKIRLRPSYFPFTEPSVEVDLTCFSCNGKGCRLCKGTGWLEVLGAGMVNPYVLDNMNIDSKKFRGFAFGLGIERIAMIKYGIPDIRLLYENDIRFLKQFKG